MAIDVKAGNADRRTAMIEWMIETLVSEGTIPEENLRALRTWLGERSEAELKSEGLRRAIAALAARGFSRSDADSGSEVARTRWRVPAVKLGMDPELNHYRAVRARRVQKARRILRDIAPRRKGRPLSRRPGVWIAAAIIPALLVVGAVWLFDAGRSGAGKYMATAHIEANADSVRHITLSDGTQVTLNRNSMFSYNDDRECELNGEAYFKVAKDAGNPFVIHSGHLDVTVLGTEFNFRAHANEGTSTLSLYEGSVQLDHATGSYRLDEAGREFSLDHATEKAVVRDMDAAQEPRWVADDRLYRFHSLGEIFDRIEATYGVRFENEAAVDTAQQLSFRLVDDASIDVLMRVLSEASGGFDYTISGEIITLVQTKQEE